MNARRVSLVGLSIALVLAALGVSRASGFGAVGDLALRDCVASGPGLCGDTIPGMSGAMAVAISPDAKSVYVASGVDGALVGFDRDLATGQLSFRSCFSAEAEDDCVTTPGISGAEAVAVSPDGKSVYVASSSASAIALFARNPATAELSFSSCVADAAGECTTQAPGLAGADGIVVSADGNSVYAISRGDDAVIGFDRSSATGALSNGVCIRDDTAGECGSSAANLGDPSSIATSPDGKSIYLTSVADGALVGFDRNTGTGALSNPTCALVPHSTCHTMGTDFEYTSGVIVSPEGNSVYAFGADLFGGVAHFVRDASGALSFASCPANESCGGFIDVASIAISPDGRSVYVSQNGEDEYADEGLFRYQRDPTSGDISARRRMPIRGGQLAVSPDNTSVYMTAGWHADHPTSLSRLFSFDRRTDATDPETSIDSSPSSTTGSRTAAFTFSSDDPSATFKCRLDLRPFFVPCSAPKTYRKLTRGRHTFAVFASDPAGNHDPTPARFKWTVRKP